MEHIEKQASIIEHQTEHICRAWLDLDRLELETQFKQGTLQWSLLLERDSLEAIQVPQSVPDCTIQENSVTFKTLFEGEETIQYNSNLCQKKAISTLIVC